MKAKATTKMTQSGSLALTFCLLLPVVFLFLLTLFDNALKDRRDLDLSRWVAANLEVNLANFDQELWQSFGLFALNKPLTAYLLRITTIQLQFRSRECRLCLKTNCSVSKY